MGRLLSRLPRVQIPLTRVSYAQREGVRHAHQQRQGVREQRRVVFCVWGRAERLRLRLRANAERLLSSAGEVTVTVSASPNFDGVSDSRTLTATAEADSYTLRCVLGLSSNTVFASFGGSAVTIARLRYASRYVEMISDDDRSSRITFGSTDTTVLLVSGAGRRQPQQNSPNLTPLQVSAAMCDGQSVSHSGINANLQHLSLVH